MSGYAGKNFALFLGSGATKTKVGGIKTTKLAISGTQVDISTKDDDGWGALLTGGGKRSATITAEVVIKNEAVQDTFVQGCINMDSVEYTIVGDSGYSYVGKFIASSIEHSGDMDGAETFSVTLNNDGALTYTKA